MPPPANPLRALYCTDTYPPQVNGVSVVTALSVAGLRARGWEVEVIAPAYPEGTADPFGATPAPGGDRGVTGIPSLALPVYPDLRLAAPSRGTVREIIARFHPLIVHATTEFVIGRLGQRDAIRCGIPVVSSYHTDFSRYMASYGMSWLRPGVGRYLARFHRRSERVFTPGEPAGAELRRQGLRDVEVWGRGVDATTFHPRRRDLGLRRVYATDDTLLLLHVGRLAAEKGVERLLAAFRLARLEVGARRPMHLIIAGAGPRERALRAQADQHVTFLGNLDRTTVLPRLYASADAFLFASETETLGLVVLEAMASGLPVIAPPAGGVVDHLVDGHNGLAFPPGDVPSMARAIVRLAHSPALRGALSAGALATAETRSWDRELDRLDISYREVIERYRAGAVNRSA